MNDGVQKIGGRGQGDDTLQFDGRYKYYQFSIKLLNLFFSQKECHVPPIFYCTRKWENEAWAPTTCYLTNFYLGKSGINSVTIYSFMGLVELHFPQHN